MNDPEKLNIPGKTAKLLNILLVSFLLILLRIWHLGTLERDDKLADARKPGKRSVIESAKRATIRDRYNTPLAINKLRFQAAVLYSDMKTIPSVAWEMKNGAKTKVYKKREHIKQLSELLAKELSLDPLRIEDEIHAKASQYYNIPFIVKDEITEEEYARLKMLSKDWPGLVVKRFSIREYPHGKLAGDVIGYLGAIAKPEYENIIQEREELKLYLEGLELGADLPLPEKFETLEQVKRRLKNLEEMAYTVYDSVGKTGIESKFEENLRGRQGKKTILTDSKGRQLKEYPGSREPKTGQRLLLSLSRELQDYAEKLLALSEGTRETKVKIDDKPTVQADKSPWVKGGAIVAMDPKTGEVLALATYPRFDPNDFILTGSPTTLKEKKEKIHSWLEGEEAIRQIWNGTRPLEKELYDKDDGYVIETAHLDWNRYLDLILSHESQVKDALKGIRTLSKGLEILQNPSKLANLTPFEKGLTLDLLRLKINEEAFSPELLKTFGKTTLLEHREHEQAFYQLEEGARDIMKTAFHDNEFREWREKNEKPFLAEKRKHEKENKKYPKPYLDYLDDEEKRQFSEYWGRHKYSLILAFIKGGSPYFETWRGEISKGAHSGLKWVSGYKTLNSFLEKIPAGLSLAYLKTLRSYDDLSRPLEGKYRLLRQQTEKGLAASFYPKFGFGYGRTHAFRQATIQGSIFKLVTAYTALAQEFKKGKKSLNLLEIDDRIFKKGGQTYVGYFADGRPIPQLYKGGRIPRSSHNHMGKMNILSALENSSNPYFALLASDILENPDDLSSTARKFGYGNLTGIELPAEIRGRVPKDLATNKTGLFATAIGQHSLVVTPLQTSVMLSALANGGKVMKPQIISLKAGRLSSDLCHEIPTHERYPLKEPLLTLGLDFPFFTCLATPQEKRLITRQSPEIKETLYMPDKIRKCLLEGMRLVVHKTMQSSLFSLSKIYHDYPEIMADYIDLKNQLIGKTSTSEALERLNLDRPDEKALYTHVWFGGLSFEEDTKPLVFPEPELVVVVYLRYGGFGKEAAPLAAQIVKKWRQIKQTHKP